MINNILSRVNNPIDWWGPRRTQEEIIGPTCPTTFTFDNDILTFDSSCPIFDLGEDVLWRMDTTEIKFSTEYRTFDEEAV